MGEAWLQVGEARKFTELQDYGQTRNCMWENEHHGYSPTILSRSTPFVIKIGLRRVKKRSDNARFSLANWRLQQWHRLVWEFPEELEVLADRTYNG